MKTTSQFSSEEFKIFIMLYASFTDYEYSEAEEVAIRSFAKSENCYDKVYKHFLSLSEYARLETIQKEKEEHYATETEKEGILKTIKEQFEVDGDFSKLEVNTLRFLDKYL